MKKSCKRKSFISKTIALLLVITLVLPTFQAFASIPNEANINLDTSVYFEDSSDDKEVDGYNDFFTNNHDDRRIRF